MEVTYNRGLYLPYHDLWMDATRVKDFAVISHGHTDHTARHRNVVTTPGTARILRHRDRLKNIVELPYGTPWEGNGFRLTLHPAGHCLGSAQMALELEDSRETMVYTGDFKLRPNATAGVAPVLPADVLVMDSTYGHPRYVFPPDEEVLDQVDAFVARALNDGAQPVVFGYALGKSQEVLKMLVERGYAVSVHPDIYSIAKLYEQDGVDFGGTYELLSSEEVKGKVVLAPPHRRTVPEIAQLARKRTAMISGWGMDRDAKYRYRVDEVFPFSDHADFAQLVHYVQEAAPKRIYTVFGFPDLAFRLQSMGYDAHHLQPHQMMLPL